MYSGTVSVTAAPCSRTGTTLAARSPPSQPRRTCGSSQAPARRASHTSAVTVPDESSGTPSPPCAGITADECQSTGVGLSRYTTPVDVMGMRFNSQVPNHQHGTLALQTGQRIYLTGCLPHRRCTRGSACFSRAAAPGSPCSSAAGSAPSSVSGQWPVASGQWAANCHRPGWRRVIGRWRFVQHCTGDCQEPPRRGAAVRALSVRTGTGRTGTRLPWHPFCIARLPLDYSGNPETKSADRSNRGDDGSLPAGCG
jgi:hypothetical protein